MIEKYDVAIDNDGDGATLEGTITIGGNKHNLSMDGSGRDMEIELDGKPCPEEIAEELSEWLAPFDAVQPILDETSDDEIEDWSGRIVDDKVARLIVRDGRELRVVRGTLADENDSELKVVSSLTSECVNDADDVPRVNEGVCRYWGAFEDSPIPNVRVFVIFNREPKSQEEADRVASEYFAY